MEHLLDAEDLELLQDEIPDVPWLGFDHDTNREYDVVPFEQYPIVRGWTPEELNRISLGKALSHDSASTLAMLQSWLFFGFLESACQEHFLSCDFIFSKTGVLQTNLLREYFTNKSAKVRASSDAASAFLATLRKSQWEANYWVNRLNVVYKQHDMFDEGALASVVRVATLLGDMLFHFERISAVNCTTWLSHESPLWHHSKTNEDSLLKRLQAQGWCLSTYDFLSTYGVSVVEFASLIESPDPRIERHQACSRKLCIANNVESDSYETLHGTCECHCEHVKAPFREMCKLLKGGRAFAVNADMLLESAPSDTSLVQLEDDTKFVALSHVWSDGRGSDAETGLPRCQVAYLRDLAREAGHTPYIWVDSLCIPRESETRKSAIRLIATVYKKASTTIVLDGGLERYSPNKRPFQELAVKILSSTLMRRLWTLQEGALARDLHFIIGNHDFTAGWMVKVAENFPNCLVSVTLARALNRMSFCSQHVDAMDISILLPLLSYRSCSKSGDESLALAPLLGLCVSPLIAVSEEERMAKFWQLIKRVPLAVPFIDGPKFQQPGLRWAVKSTISTGESNTLYGRPDAVITADGLEGEYLVLDFENTTKINQNSAHHLRFRHGHDSAQLPLPLSKECEDQSSLGIKEQFDMALKTTSKTPVAPCDALALLDRFYPESFAVLLRGPQKDRGSSSCEIYEYVGIAFMIVMDGVDALQNKIYGTVSEKKICIS